MYTNNNKKKQIDLLHNGGTKWHSMIDGTGVGVTHSKQHMDRGTFGIMCGREKLSIRSADGVNSLKWKQRRRHFHI